MKRIFLFFLVFKSGDDMIQKYISKRERDTHYPEISMQKIEEHNQNFIKFQKEKYHSYFENMFQMIDPNIRLDQEQIEAIIVDEDYEMIIAGAGSGKTTTMAAKVKYLVEIEKVSPSQIMIISYTNEAVNELKDRIQNGFKIPVEIATFHKLCLNILKQKQKQYKIIDDNHLIIKKYFQEKRKYYHRYLFYHHFKAYLFYFLKNLIIEEDIKLCVDFINRFQTNGYENFQVLFTKYLKKRKIRSFLLLTYDIMHFYQDYLKKNQLIDFDGMINQCYSILEETPLSYRYLIIDEYQDISYIRFRLIRKIAELYHTKIIVVGDDFQSIYSFSGSDLSLFVDFEKKMGYTKSLKITSTYRNSQELIDIIGSFVMKNPFQIPKKLSSSKHISHPIILIEYQNNLLQKLKEILEEIILTYSENKNILLLGRYRHDLSFLDSSFKLKQNKIQYLKYPQVEITFLTVHASKGLGFDNVVILNNQDALYGFPSKVKDPPYLKMISLYSEKYPFAEERRLFYVALTRTKNQVYLLYPKKNPSIFITEIQKYLLK